MRRRERRQPRASSMAGANTTEPVATALSSDQAEAELESETFTACCRADARARNDRHE